MKNILMGATVLGAASLLLVSSGSAQTSDYGLTGNIPGMCVVSSGSLLEDSSVGKAIDARLKVLVGQVRAELQSEGTAIETERNAIETAAKSATTPAAQAPLQKRAQALQQRFDAYQQKTQLREAEMRQTSNKALAKVSEAARPLIRVVGNQKNCGVVLDNSAVADANPSMDITAAVVTQLNAKLPTMTFERERITPSATTPAAR